MDYYDLNSLSRALGKLEERYGLSSEEFMKAHLTDSPAVAEIPGFSRHIWASFYRDVERIEGSRSRSEFVAGVDKTLALN
jgi:hypothetical protein